MIRKYKLLTTLLLSSIIMHNAKASVTVNEYDDLITELADPEADVVLNMNGKGLDLETADGVTIAEGQNVVLQNIGTKDTSSWTNTARNIANHGTLAVDKVIFSDNYTNLASQSGGGNLYNYGHITSITDTSFIKNTQESTGTIWGGVLRNTDNGTIDLIKNVVFANNFAKSSVGAPHGGVILNGYGTTSTGHIGVIDGVDFINNSMTSEPNQTGGAHGVAIDNNEGGTIDKITNSRFINNKTYRTGVEEKTGNYHASAGGLDNYNYIGEISNTLFQGNGAETESVSANSGSGAIMNLYGGEAMMGRIDKIVNVEFIDNYVKAKNGIAGTGALVNGSGSGINDPENTGSIGVLENVLFQGNHAVSENNTAYAGALRNSGELGDITGSFKENYAKGGWNNAGYIGAYGGAIMNSGSKAKIGLITADFENNYTENTGISSVYGGAIYNRTSSSIAGVIGDFTGNFAKSTGANASGGAIASFTSNAEIGFIKGNFSDNYINAGTSAAGGAIYNASTSSITSIEGNFTNNSAIGGTNANGGAIYNSNGTITSIEGNFTNNSVIGDSSNGNGGAINNNTKGIISSIKGNFSGNYAKSTEALARGGAIINYGNIDELSGVFENNYAESTDSYALGGAIFNAISSSGTGGVIENIKNSSFINNYASGNEETKGGAIYSKNVLNITADAGESLFSGNYIETAGEKTSNAIYMDEADLTLSAINNGSITFNDGINGSNYNINVDGDGTGVISFNNTVEAVNNLNIGKEATLHIGLGAEVTVENMSVISENATDIENVATSSAKSIATPIIKIDIRTDVANNKIDTGIINVNQDVSGDYKVIVNALNSDVLNNKNDAVVAFLSAPNDDLSTESSFSVARVIGNPYLWDTIANVNGDEEGTVWYLEQAEKLNPDYDGLLTAPEVVTAMGLHEAAIEQTRSVFRNVSNKVESTHVNKLSCGSYRYDRNFRPLHNVWALANGEKATVDETVDMDAKIWGLEAGFDFQNDLHHTLGMFVSYRDGKYDFSGKSNQYYSKIGSEIDINSYLAGLYYRYDYNQNWAFATVFGGVQNAEAQTDDGIAKFDTDGLEIGAGIEAGHTFALVNNFSIDPSLGVSYTQINYDDAYDNVGKEYNWGNIKHLEAEFGVKLAKQFYGNSNVYVKPSVIHTLASGNTLSVSGLNREVDTYEDQTLGRIEAGGRYYLTSALSTYGWLNYTFGSNYTGTALGAGINYAW